MTSDTTLSYWYGIIKIYIKGNDHLFYCKYYLIVEPTRINFFLVVNVNNITPLDIDSIYQWYVYNYIISKHKELFILQMIKI